jgi:hypothetical protein
LVYDYTATVAPISRLRVFPTKGKLIVA